MRRLPLALLALALCAPAFGAREPAGLPPGLTRTRLQTLLQRFVDAEYMKAFRHLGDERDFDHGHLLFDAKTHKPAAILYHTQELAYYQPPGSPFGFVDPAARNWLQWIGDGRRIENASAYVRRSYPSGGSWDWFTHMELPVLRAHHTILDKMLDGKRLGLDTSRSEQWVFTREPCARGAPRSDHSSGRASPPPMLRVTLPDRGRVCLALSRT